MGVEIERKFVVTSDAWRRAPGVRVVQAYLAREAACSVRVRIVEDTAWLSVKGRARDGAKPEFEYVIPVPEAKELIELSPYPVIEKVRRKIEYEGFVWEVDEFFGANAGLVVAEIELDAPDQPFPLPPWIGQDVTDDPRYINANLVVHPYGEWKAHNQ